MSYLPRISIVRDRQVEEGYQYRVFIGRKDGEIVCLALSRYGALTIPILLLEVDAIFSESTVFVDVYQSPHSDKKDIVAKFWSQKHTYCYEEEPFDPFLNDNTKEEWAEVLGVDVSFYPYGGPANKPERFPGFPKKPPILTPVPEKPVSSPPQPVGEDDWMIPF